MRPLRTEQKKYRPVTTSPNIHRALLQGPPKLAAPISSSRPITLPAASHYRIAPPQIAPRKSPSQSLVWALGRIVRSSRRSGNCLPLTIVWLVWRSIDSSPSIVVPSWTATGDPTPSITTPLGRAHLFCSSNSSSHSSSSLSLPFLFSIAIASVLPRRPRRAPRIGSSSSSSSPSPPPVDHNDTSAVRPPRRAARPPPTCRPPPPPGPAPPSPASSPP